MLSLIFQCFPENGGNTSGSGKSVPCKSAHLARCPAAFLSRHHESSWCKERLLWGLLQGALLKERKPRHLGGFPQLLQSCCASLRPRAALGFPSALEEWSKQLALQWGLNACGALKSQSGLLGLCLHFSMCGRRSSWRNSQEHQLHCTKLSVKPVLRASGGASSFLA